MPRLSQREVDRRNAQRSAGARSAQLAPRPPPNLTARLLVTRAEAAQLIGCSTSTLWRMEKEHRLRPVKLSSKPNGVTYYASADLLLLTTTTAGR
jgi:hypothetical protein